MAHIAARKARSSKQNGQRERETEKTAEHKATSRYGVLSLSSNRATLLAAGTRGLRPPR